MMSVNDYASAAVVLDEVKEQYGWLSPAVFHAPVKDGRISTIPNPERVAGPRQGVFLHREQARAFLAERNAKNAERERQQAERDARQAEQAARRAEKAIAKREKLMTTIAADPQGYRQQMQDRLVEAQRNADYAEAMIREAVEFVRKQQ